MARYRSPKRHNLNLPGHAHALTCSCYKGLPFFKSERICEWLAETIEKARIKQSFHLWAYVIMPEHLHLIVHPQADDYDIAEIRKSIKSPLGLQAIQLIEAEAPDWLPRITRKRGKKTERLFWQSGGGYDRNITEPATLLKMIDYIHMNPVRKTLAERPEQWKWSSASWFLENGEPPIVPDKIPAEWMP